MFREKRKDGTTRLMGAVNTLTMEQVLDRMWPVGAIYTSHVSTNPGTLFGGTWAAHAAGRVLVGLNAEDDDFDTVGETGGAKTHTLVSTETPNHVHPAGSLVTGTTGNHDHQVTSKGGGSTADLGGTAGLTKRGAASGPGGEFTGFGMMGGNGDHSHNISGETANPSGTNGQPHNNVQPYIVVYMWRRTA